MPGGECRYLDIANNAQVSFLAGLLGLGHALILHFAHIPWRHHLQAQQFALDMSMRLMSTARCLSLQVSGSLLLFNCCQA